MKNSTIVSELVDLLGRPICYAGGEITKSNPITLHHALIQVKDGGKTTLDNCCMVAHLEHNGIHVLADHNRYHHKSIHDYFMDRIDEALTYRTLDRAALIQFNAWLQSEVAKNGLRVHRTKDNLLIYKRK